MESIHVNNPLRVTILDFLIIIFWINMVVNICEDEFLNFSLYIYLKSNQSIHIITYIKIILKIWKCKILHLQVSVYYLHFILYF